MKKLPIIVCLLLLMACKTEETSPLRLWYSQPAEKWTEALPVGNGRLGAMVFGGVEKEHIQFNEETLWTGEPTDYAHKGAFKYLEEIRELLSQGKQNLAQELAMKEFMSTPLRQRNYQPFGDIFLDFPGHEDYTNYRRELNISEALCQTSYEVHGVRYRREVIASSPHEVIAIRLTCDKGGALNFSVGMDSEHREKNLETNPETQVLNVAVEEGMLKGAAGIRVNTDGQSAVEGDRIIVSGASSATIWLSAASNFISFRDVSGDETAKMFSHLAKTKDASYKQVREEHIADYRTLFDRFSIDFGASGRDSLPTDQRLDKFAEEPEDPSLLALYTQYGRYLMISASRPGTQPSNLQGIWNQDMKPAWGSKYTTNINAEMNYWPAELTNLSDCHEPFFKMVEECSETGAVVAREHYNADGWVLHHNTDLWRGTAPINHSNHGIWVGGSGWASLHFWEHYLFTGDKTFLRERAYPVMKGAATFYTQYLVKDSVSGWLISTPSNSPENGGLVAGPTMDHQIIRSLFNACAEAASILEIDEGFATGLLNMAGQIAPNQVGQYGQLQEWLTDLDNPENKHRHVSHLWGMHPGRDINWEKKPNLMEAAKKTLEFRGDDGTGWSLAWKINFWARLLEGDHAYDLIKMQFRPVQGSNTKYSGGGGSYPNLFDAHPPFQIDGNFGASAGIVEMLVQSHLSAINILPSLPTALPNGKLTGVCARGGFELSFSWKEGALEDLEVLSKNGGLCRLNYRDHSTTFETIKGERYKLDGLLNQLF